MRFAIYSRGNKKDLKAINEFILLLGQQQCTYVLHESTAISGFSKQSGFKGYYSNHRELKAHKPEFLITFGGDGTVLDTLLLVMDSGIPVIGCNTGRLGFLSTISPQELELLLDHIKNGIYSVGKRTVLQIESVNHQDKTIQYALNDISIHKRDTSAMITVETHLNGAYFNTYWADGLLISTPTGSTAYSLSCGGPVMFPNSAGYIINPVAPHNLNVRPVVVSDQTVINLKVKGRGSNYLMALDSRHGPVDYGKEFSIRKAPFEQSFIELPEHDFIDTLRQKLNWGKDNRNK